jgi:GDP-D-mannose dehydratase
MTDFNTSLLRVAEKAYNLAARPHVQPSLEEPEYTASADAPRDPTPAGGNSVFSDSSERRAFTSRVRRNCAVSGTGDAAERDDAVYPRSSCAVAKLYGYWIVVHLLARS